VDDVADVDEIAGAVTRASIDEAAAPVDQACAPELTAVATRGARGIAGGELAQRLECGPQPEEPRPAHLRGPEDAERRVGDDRQPRPREAQVAHEAGEVLGTIVTDQDH